MWPKRRLLDLVGIEFPIVQAPMAGANGSAMAIAVSEAGGIAVCFSQKLSRRNQEHLPWCRRSSMQSAYRSLPPAELPMVGVSRPRLGTAYLFTPQSLITELHRALLSEAHDDQTALTNVFSGRPARGLINRVMCELGPMSNTAPAFPMAGSALAPLKAKAEAAGVTDFSSLWSGQAASLGRESDAGDLTRRLAADAQQRLKALASTT